MQTTLRLDYDVPLDTDGIELLEKRVSFVSDIVGIPLEMYMLWRTQRGAHVIIQAHREGKQLEPVEVVLLQCLLGSDWRRECFNFQRVRVLADAPAFWQDRWNVLYSEKLREI